MRNFKKLMFVGIALLFIGITSCDKIKELTEKDISTTISETTPLIMMKSTSMAYSTIDVSINNSKTEEYINHIKDVDIKSFTYEIAYFGNEKNIYEVTATITAPEIEFGTETIQLKKAFDNRTIFKITNTAALNKPAKLLKKGKKVPITLNYKTNDYGTDEKAEFKIKITMDVNVTVGL